MTEVAYELDLDFPNLAKGEEVQIAGLGTFKNGETVEITKEQAQAYRAYHSSPEPIQGEDEEVLGSEQKPGPTLLQASKNMYGVEVTTVTSSNKGGDN